MDSRVPRLWRVFAGWRHRFSVRCSYVQLIELTLDLRLNRGLHCLYERVE
jgi:hypothetical protein